MIKKYNYLLSENLPVNCRLMSEDEADLLLRDCLDEILDGCYESDDENFGAFMESYSPGRSDDELIKMILKIYGDICCMPFYTERLKDMRKAVCEKEPFENTPFVGYLTEYTDKLLEGIISKYEYACDYTASTEGLEKQTDLFNGELEIFKRLYAEKDIKKRIKGFQNITFERATGAKRGSDTSVNLGIRNRVKKIVANISETFRDFVPRYIQMDLAFDPGTEQLYSGLAAPDVVAAVVEKVSGEDYADYLKNHITGPLGMKDTAYEITEEQRARVVVPGAWDPESGTCKPAVIRPSEFFGDNPVGLSGGGCLYSTLADYGRFAQMLLREGEFDGVRILSAESVREIAKPRLPDTIRGINRHFNWGLLVRVLPNTHSERQPLPAGTFGWSGAFTTTAGGAGAITAKEFETAILSAVREV